MRKIDFYKRKEKLHKQIIEAICKIMDEHMVEKINFMDLGMDGGYVCVAPEGPSVETRVLELKHPIGSNFLQFVPEDVDGCWFDGKWFSFNDDVLNASFDTVYEAVYDLFYSKRYKEERKRLYDKQKGTQGAAD